MSRSHTTRTEGGGAACRYCGRRYEDQDGADAHVRELTQAGMLQDHIAIHWKRGEDGPSRDGRRTRAPHAWLDAFSMRLGDE